MANHHHLNVFKGPDSLRDYLGPAKAPPLPLVEVHGALNPYRRDGVRIYAKAMSMRPANNVKAIPGTCRRLARPPSPESARQQRRAGQDRHRRV